ncbi:MAG: GGDEF domain-containing protein [Lachnospiraceae bacterium]|nr:GGDEF domain-containing protein [Lachnospiraceae bacterium]
MKSKNTKKIEKMKKKHGLLAIFAFILTCVVATMMLSYFVYSLVFYLLEAKLSSEYESISYMARIYEQSISEDYEGDVWAILNEDGREYIIRDKNGNLLVGDKDNTCSEDGAPVKLSGIDCDVEVFVDKEYPFVTLDREGLVTVRMLDLLDYIQDHRKDPELFLLIDDGDVSADTSNVLFFESDSYLRLPVWMGMKVTGGEETFIGKGFVYIRMSDVSIVLITTVILGLLFFIIFMLFLVNMIGNIKSQKRSMKLFFMDLATGGHNRMWYIYKGEALLKKRSSASYQYAVVSLLSVKYNTFCMCHSVSEGEEIIRKVSDCIGRHITRHEVFAHESPESFMLLLRVKDQDELTGRLGAIISDLEKIDNNHSFTYHLGVSVLLPPRDANGRVLRRRYIDLEQDYNNAVTARNTLNGKEDSGVAYFDLKLVEERKWHDQVEEHCREALVNQEFLVYYQPKYDPVTGLMRGTEALIRWQSPTLGFVSPGKFIPIFEHNGFITEIDHYMLEHVALDQKKWMDEGIECVPISVNISRAHFIESDLAEQIRDTVDRAGAPRNLIEIELTESAFFDDKNALIKTISKLKEYGFAVSMDDFGSGYSSLNSLKDMPLDILKLDAEFFRGDGQGERGKIVVSETIKLARSLNMRTVAEGVEIKEQVDFLAEQGCDMIQGFYYAKPMPADEYVKKLAEKKADK